MSSEIEEELSFDIIRTNSISSKDHSLGNSMEFIEIATQGTSQNRNDEVKKSNTELVFHDEKEMQNSISEQFPSISQANIQEDDFVKLCNLVEEHKKLKENSQKLNNTLETLQKFVKDSIKEKNKIIKELTTDNTQLTTTNQELNRQLKEAEAENCRFKKDMDDVKGALHNLNTSLMELKDASECTVLKDQISEKNKDLEYQHVVNEINKLEIKGMDNELKSLKNKLITTEALNADLDANNIELKGKVDEYERQLEAAQDEIDLLKAQDERNCENFNNEQKKLVTEKEKLVIENNNLKVQIKQISEKAEKGIKIAKEQEQKLQKQQQDLVTLYKMCLESVTTKANIIFELCKMIPEKDVVVSIQENEKPKGKKSWNESFLAFLIILFIGIFFAIIKGASKP